MASMFKSRRYEDAEKDNVAYGAHDLNQPRAYYDQKRSKAFAENCAEDW